MVTVYDVGRIQVPSTIVPVGTPPTLPTTVKVIDTDGVTQQLLVRWSNIRPRQYARPGRFTIRGWIPAIARRVRIVGDAR